MAELRDSECLFAVKCLKKQTVIEDDDVESIMIERKVLAYGSSNPFICKLFCTFQTEVSIGCRRLSRHTHTCPALSHLSLVSSSQSHLFFAMEWCSGGDLMFHVQKDGKFGEDKAR